MFRNFASSMYYCYYQSKQTNGKLPVCSKVKKNGIPCETTMFKVDNFREPKMKADQPVVHLQFCWNSIAIQWNLIRKECRKEWSKYLIYNLQHIHTNFTLEICYSICFYGIKRSLRNGAGQTIAKMVNSNYTLNITLAVQTNSK